MKITTQDGVNDANKDRLEAKMHEGYRSMFNLTSEQKIRLSTYEPRLNRILAGQNLDAEIYDDLPQVKNWLVSIVKEIFPDIARRIDDAEEVFDGPNDVLEFLLFMILVAKNETANPQSK